MSKKLFNEAQVNSLIYRLVKESLEAMPSNYNFEESGQDSDDENNDEKKRGDKYRQEVEAFFKQPGVNPAQYAYDLYGVTPVEGDDTNDMKNARSKFMKCLNHETNQDGYEYAFNSEEINKLKLMISSNQVGGNMTNENKVLMNEEQFNDFITEMVNKSITKLLQEYSSADVKQAGGNNLRYRLSPLFGGKYRQRMDRRIKSTKDYDAYTAKQKAEAEAERKQKWDAEQRRMAERDAADRRNREAYEKEQRRGSSIGTQQDYNALNRGDYRSVNPSIAYSMWKKGQITQNEYLRVCQANGVQPKY